MTRIRRLGSDDVALAAALFQLMGDVFDEGAEPLRAPYIAKLLSRDDFWVLAAWLDGELVGGLTAHTLQMTRDESSEIFLYDLAVRNDRQRRGIGRELVATLCDLAAAIGVDVMFVPADDEDEHALDFYRAIGGEAAPVTMFTFTRCK